MSFAGGTQHFGLSVDPDTVSCDLKSNHFGNTLDSSASHHASCDSLGKVVVPCLAFKRLGFRVIWLPFWDNT